MSIASMHKRIYIASDKDTFSIQARATLLQCMRDSIGTLAWDAYTYVRVRSLR